MRRYLQDVAEISGQIIRYKMLEGTDLNSAWGPLLAAAEPQMNMAMEQEVVNQPTLQHQTRELIASQSAEASASKAAGGYEAPVNSTAMSFNDQYEKEQKLLAIINELKRRQAAGVAGPQQPSYWDKLMSKKKDLIKFFQSALIILFAISIHFLIQHYFQQYISSNDVSFERELILRLLYPIGVAFVAWNVMLIYK
jgi:hypothetical protein